MLYTIIFARYHAEVLNLLGNPIAPFANKFGLLYYIWSTSPTLSSFYFSGPFHLPHRFAVSWFYYGPPPGLLPVSIFLLLIYTSHNRLSGFYKESPVWATRIRYTNV